MNNKHPVCILVTTMQTQASSANDNNQLNARYIQRLLCGDAFVKNVFLKIWQNSQENTCVRVPL